MLSNIDLARHTATCTMCGDTQIYVYENSKLAKIYIRCLNKRRETNQVWRQRRADERRLQNPNWKPQHKLSGINTEILRAVCSVCGPADIVKNKISPEHTAYYCANRVRATVRKSLQKLQNRQPPTYKPSRVMLVQQEHQQLVDEYKVKQGCKSCGYNEDPLQLELHFSDVDEKQFSASNLICFKRKRFFHALQISEVYCVRCHLSLHNDSDPLQSAALYQTVE